MPLPDSLRPSAVRLQAASLRPVCAFLKSVFRPGRRLRVRPAHAPDMQVCLLPGCLHSGSSETSQISLPHDPHLTECEHHSLDAQGRRLRVSSGSSLSHPRLPHRSAQFSYEADPSSTRVPALHCGGRLQDPIISPLAWAGVFLPPHHHQHRLTLYDPKQNPITRSFSLEVLFCQRLIGRRPKSLTWSRSVPCRLSPRLEPHSSSSLPGLLAVPGTSTVLC